jgi:AbrB family looped-hinge helix DNA binding protein
MCAPRPPAALVGDAAYCPSLFFELVPCACARVRRIVVGRLQYRDRSEKRMSTITVSSKYQIVIPSKIREALGIKPGEKLHVIEYRGGGMKSACRGVLSPPWRDQS